MKKCRKCHRIFQPVPNQLRRFDYICRSCVNAYRRDWAKERRKLGLPTGGECSKEWWQNYNRNYYSKPEVKARRAKLMREYRQDPAIRMKHEARWQTSKAIKSGRLKRQSCEVCGEKRTQAHHEDYRKPLEVRWLCVNCHRIEHAKATGGGE